MKKRRNIMMILSLAAMLLPVVLKVKKFPAEARKPAARRI